MPTLEEIRHSTAHILASAVIKLFPKTKLGIGPVIENGFYYDFDSEHTFTLEDLPKIEEEMKSIIKQNLKFEKKVITSKIAEKQFKDDPYKLELIQDLEKENKEISFYITGDFVDLCKGPHVESTKQLGFFKLLKISGSYWKGNANNKPMQRIYGTAFETKEKLKEYLNFLEEAKKRDHRILGKELDLFSFHEESPGSPFFHPKGTIIYNELQNFIRCEYKKRGYQEVITPLIYDKSLWETSGHWKHYKDDMFILNVDNKEFSLKPMNCPSHCLLYKTSLKSYKDLPLRIADFAPLHRNELKGVLAGITRTRKFSQDDAHIFCTEKQLEKELEKLIEFIDYIYHEAFDFMYDIKLSTRPEDYMGELENWNKAEEALKKALENKKIKYQIQEREGAFYGPKIDINVKDALKRSWQVATIQLDFQMPKNFKLTYEGEDGKKHTPIMIHRAILGSLERFIAVLIEHYSGKLPLWLSPTQVVIITVSDKHIDYANKLKVELRNNNIRAETDSRQESIPKKVRDNQKLKIPFIITIGDKEIETNELAVRTRDNEIKNLDKEKFIEKIKKEIKNKI